MMLRKWFLMAFITTITWGIWGAFIEIPERNGFPATLGYCIWALTMIPCAIIGLGVSGWKLDYDKRSFFLGMVTGLLGAGGQLLLFEALKDGPAYLVFPLVSLFPVLTIISSVLLLKEHASGRSWIGIGIALAAIAFLSYQPPSPAGTRGHSWLFLTILVFIFWGLQAFFMKFSNNSMKAESIFFYMMLTSLLLIPVAVNMTSFTGAINWGLKGAMLAAVVHLLNSIGALTLVYALRYGKSIIVVPMTGLSPLITILLSLMLYHVVPGPVLICGMILAMISIFLLSE